MREGERGGVAEGLDAGRGGVAAGEPGAFAGEEILDGGAIGRDGALARAARARGDGDVAGEGDARLDEAAAVGEAVEQAERVGGGGVERVAADDGGEGGGEADQAGQALGAAGARQEAELDLGQAEFRPRIGDPIVAGECEFEAAAQRGAVDGGDDRRAGGFDPVEQGGKRRLDGRAGELGDVGAAGEGGGRRRR